MQTETQDWQSPENTAETGATDHTSDHARDDVQRAARREIDDAKARLSSAADRVRHEARNAGTTISTLVLDELDRRAADMGAQMGVVAQRLRAVSANEETETDTGVTMAAQAADLIEDASARLQAESMRDLGHRLGRYGRENPALFVLGCLVTGAMVGRMIIASDSSTSQNRRYAGMPEGSVGRGWND